MSDPTGKLIIQLQGAIQSLEITNENELSEFLDDLGATLPKRLRQILMTWRSNYHNNQVSRQRHIASQIDQRADSRAREEQRAKERRQGERDG